MADLETLGDYEITRRIASGGMGTVYLAKNTKSNREVALKVLSAQMSQDPEFVARFQREAQATAALRHPHVVQVYDTGVVDNNRYIAMEYLSGGTLHDEIKQLIIKNEMMPLARAIQITRQIASALDYAHKRGLVHRDIKPSNIMIAGDGRFVLTDFGIVMTQGGTKLTKNVETIGTPEYMSPEQIQGKIPDKRSDIYSLGIVLYEMLTGTAPFKAENTLAVLYKHVNEAPPPISGVRPELSNAIQALVNKAIAKDPEKRFQTSGEFIQALDRAMLGKSVEAPSRRPLVIGGLIAVMGLALVVAVAGIVVGRGSTPAASPKTTVTVLATAALASTPTLSEVSTAAAEPSATLTSPEPTTTTASEPTSQAPSVSTPTAEPTATQPPTPTTPPTRTPIPATNTPTSREPTPIPISTSSPKAYLQAVANDTIVRSGPSTDYETVGTLPFGVSVPVIGKTKTDEYDWWQVTFPQSSSGFGWVRGDVVSFVGGNPGLVPTAAPWTLTPYSATVRFSPRNSIGEVALGNGGESKTTSLDYEMYGVNALALEITSDLNGDFDCVPGNLASVSPQSAVGKRQSLTLPRGGYVVTVNDPGYYVFSLYVTRVDGSELTITRNVIVGCNRTGNATATPSVTATVTPIP